MVAHAPTCSVLPADSLRDHLVPLQPLEVVDNGPGLRGADGERIFDPFARGEAQVRDARPGVGLGLYLVAELTRALGGEVRAEDTGDGTRVSVALPLVREGA